MSLASAKFMSFDDLLSRGVAALAGDTEKAVELLEECTKKDPNPPPEKEDSLNDALGIAYLREKNISSAQRCLNRCLELATSNNDKGRAHGNLGATAAAVGQFADAAEHAEKSAEFFCAASNFPCESRAMYNAAVSYFQLKRYASSHRAIQKARAARERSTKLGTWDACPEAIRSMGSEYERLHETLLMMKANGAADLDTDPATPGADASGPTSDDPATPSEAGAGAAGGANGVHWTPTDSGRQSLRAEGYSLAELQGELSPHGIDPLRKEDFLSEEEFAAAFDGMSREELKALPDWKRDQKKKALGIF